MDELLVIDSMKQLGLNEYEAKAYLKLLEEYPVNGYILSKNSGIPRSRIYEVLDGLVKKQIVFEEIDGKFKIYHPLEPRLLIKKFRSHYEDIIDDVEIYTKKKFEKQTKNSSLLILRGRKEILEFLKSLIDDAKSRIAISMWEEELCEIADSLDQAINRNVVLKGIYFGHNNPYKEVVSHRRIQRYISEKKERYLIVIVDNKHIISGIVSRGDESQVIWSRDRGLIEMGDNYIAHDLMINLYSEKLQGEEKKEFESYLDNIRERYFGFSEKML